MTLKTKKLPIPGLLWGMYPERNAQTSNNNTLKHVSLIANRLTNRESTKLDRFIKDVRLLEKTAPTFDSKQYNHDLQALQTAMRRDGFIDIHLAKAFALINQAFSSIMNLSLFDTQMMAAYHMLNNRLTEMATGEGKTFAVALASATAALSGVPVHVITANDYLAERDTNSLNALYQALGLTADAAIHGQEATRRKQAYACNITYCTAKEIVFDYLRDGIHRQKQPTIWHSESADNTAPLLLRGLCMAIIDEADSILIDEARVPLILSKAVNNQQENKYYSQSLNLARHLIVHQDYKLNASSLQVQLTDAGRVKLETAAHTLPAVWHNRLHREETICQALAALNLYHRDQHYLVHKDEVHIIDETTGRIAKGRAWSRGLQQLIELKENCEPSGSLLTIAQITYQRFFPRYFRLSGVSGTLLESRSELFQTYGLSISKVPLRSPNQRKVLPTRLFEDQIALNNALVKRINSIRSSGRPVLIGTESVTESELLSSKLNQSGIAHTVLNAKNDENEAELVALAGQAGAITITTNMAGRGTDIKLGQHVNAAGGLHVLSCQVNTSRRVDRQLIGRSARQGDYGSAEAWVSLKSTLLQKRLPLWLTSIAKRYAQQLPNYIIKSLIYISQRAEERHQTLLRRRLLSSDKALEKNLSFGGVHD